MARPRFHLAIPVDDLEAAAAFYGGVLGCRMGRSAETWIDWDLYEHQLVTHLAPGSGQVATNPVDDNAVPVPHFGVLLTVDAFHALAERLRTVGTEFAIEPYVRFEGSIGEQWTMFFRDPAGNAIEIKAFADDGQVFAVS